MSAGSRLRDNPFFVLGIGPMATAQEVERQGQKLLGLLAVNHAASAVYASPLGDQPRDADAVRAALLALRDPARRVVAEFWAEAAASRSAAGTEGPAETPPAPGDLQLFRVLGFAR